MDGPFSQDALVGVSSKIHNLIPGGREHGDDFSTSDRAAAAAEKLSHLEKCSRSEHSVFWLFLVYSLSWVEKWILLFESQTSCLDFDARHIVELLLRKVGDSFRIFMFIYVCADSK